MQFRVSALKNLWIACCSVTKMCPFFATPWTAACQASLSFTIFQSLLKLTFSILNTHWNRICSVQLISRVRLFATPWTIAHQASLSITNSWSPPKPMSIESVTPSNHLILFIPSPSALNLFQHQGLFKWVGSSHQVAKILEFQLQHQSLGLISFRMDWLDLLAVQGILKSLLQHHSSKASILQRSAFFIFQLSHPYMTTGKTIALTRRTFVDKVMSLLFNMLSRLVITFLPRSKRLLISWLQSQSAVIYIARFKNYCCLSLTARYSDAIGFGMHTAYQKFLRLPGDSNVQLTGAICYLCKSE